MKLTVPEPPDYFRLLELMYRVCVYFLGRSQRALDQRVEQRAQQLAAQERTKAHWRGFIMGCVIMLVIVIAFSHVSWGGPET